MSHSLSTCVAGSVKYRPPTFLYDRGPLEELSWETHSWPHLELSQPSKIRNYLPQRGTSTSTAALVLMSSCDTRRGQQGLRAEQTPLPLTGTEAVTLYSRPEGVTGQHQPWQLNTGHNTLRAQSSGNRTKPPRMQRWSSTTSLTDHHQVSERSRGLSGV